MTSSEMFRKLYADAGYQLEKSFEGMADSCFRSKPNSQGMSPKEIAVHLAEAYVAGQKHFSGESHEWGTYQMDSPQQDVIIANMFEERKKFKDAIEAKGDEDAMKTGLDYGVNHDFYHVGQICSHRIENEPDWNAYSIYNFD